MQDPGPVRVVMYDLLGRQVATLYDGTPTAGQEKAITRSIPPVPSGRYFLRLEGASVRTVQPLTVVR